MAEKFDAYFKWLSIPPEQQPPHFYQLLGIPALTEDPDVIESGANSQTKHIRKYLDSEYRSYAEKILKNIEAVRDCLLDPDKKAEYDGTLRRKIGAIKAKSSPTATPAAAKPQLAAANSVANDDAAADAASVLVPQHRRPLVLAGAVAVMLLIAAVAAVLYFLRDPGPATAASDTVLRPVPPKTQTEKGGGGQPAIQPADSPPNESPTNDANDDPDASEAGQAEPDKATPDPNLTTTTNPESIARRTPIDPEPDGSVDPPAASDGEPARSVDPPAALHPEPPVRLPPPPTDESQQAKLELIRELFKSEYDQAQTPEALSALAGTLMAEGDRTTTDPVGRFCLYHEARDLALQAADVDTALQAIGRIAANYEIDQWQWQVAALEGGAAEIRGSEAVASFVATCFQLLDAPLADDRYDVAQQIVAAAATAGRKTRDVALKKEIAERRRAVDEMKEEFDRITQALAALDQDPKDGDANLTAGRYFCFNENDWQRGLPLLAAGSDAGLAAQARAELDAPSQADAELDVAEGWWTLGEKERDAVQHSIFRHASELVRQRWSSLDGLAKVKWEKRLKEASPKQVATADKTPTRSGGNVPADKPEPPDQAPGTIPDNPAYKDVLSVVDAYEQIYRQRKRATYQPRVFEAEKDFKHATGERVEDGWIAVRGRHNPDKAVMYGPYITDIPAGGPHMATFRMMVSGQIEPRKLVASVDVVDTTANKTLISQSIEAGAVQRDQYFDVGLPFFCEADSRIEFRVWWKDNGALKIDRVTLSPAPILIPNAWYTTFYAWPKWSGVPDKKDWQTILRTRPIGQRVLSHLGLFWYFPLNAPTRPFAIVANAAIDLPAGRYEMTIISDDGARAYVDGRQVISNWWPHPSRRESALVTVGAGKHAVRIEHCGGPAVNQIQCWFRPVTR